MTFVVNMDEMKFGLAAIATDGVIGRRMDVPAFQKDCFVVVCNARMIGPVSIVCHSKSRSVAPIIPVA